MLCIELQVLKLLDGESKYSWMKKPVGCYWHAKKFHLVIDTWSKSKHTLSKPRKVLTDAHSSLVVFSRVLLFPSKFINKCINTLQRRVSMNVWFNIYYTPLFFAQPNQASYMLRTTVSSCQEWVKPPACDLPWFEQFSRFLFAWRMNVPG